MAQYIRTLYRKIYIVNFDLPWSCPKLLQSKRYNNILMQNSISILKQLVLRKEPWHERNRDNFYSMITINILTPMPIESNGKMKRITGHALKSLFT